VAGVGDLVQRTGDGCTGWVLGGWAIERLGGTVHVEMRSADFLVEPQNQGRRFISLKTTGTVSLRFVPQNR
jgi:hypothetical protein